MLCAADAQPSGFQIRFSPLLPTRQTELSWTEQIFAQLPPCLDPAAAELRDSAHVPPYILAKAFGDNGNFLKHQRRPSEAAEEMAAMAARQNGAKSDDREGGRGEATRAGGREDREGGKP